MQKIKNMAEDVQAVITSYNQGEMVREAVDSLCNQTMLPSKIIIVDDGSTDEIIEWLLSGCKQRTD